MKYKILLTSAFLLTLSGCGIINVSNTGAEPWIEAGIPKEKVQATYQEWCQTEGIDEDSALSFIRRGANNPKLVKEWGEFYKIDTTLSKEPNQLLNEALRWHSEDIAIYTKNNITPQRYKEITDALSNAPYTVQQQLPHYIPATIIKISNNMDTNHLSAQEAINKIKSTADQELNQNRLADWSAASVKRCHNQIFSLQDTWTDEKNYVSGRCYTVRANIFQKISSNKILSKIIVFSDYQFQLIYVEGAKPISGGEYLLVVPMKNFRYKNIVGNNKEINGFRVIEQQ